ncbi:MAG: L-ascorbate 6-phosphate lactonase [Verrucomicrobiales bacterium]|nr:L-ascorbate 6-phosphate lactonase [Verrucomicrobiales bacterium]
MVTVNPLGQSGFRFVAGSTIFYVDPYLSDAVERKHGPQFSRQVPLPMSPTQVTDANLVMISHGHTDHCDPITIATIAMQSPQAIFICTYESVPILEKAGVAANKIQLVTEPLTPLTKDISYAAIPAAHPTLERDSQGRLRRCGFLLHFENCLVYHAGDTSPHVEIFRALEGAEIDYAFLPVNEKNFFRDQKDIIGNMSVREAFHFAEKIGAKRLVPMHFDMFAPNSVFPEEIELLYEKLQPAFKLEFLWPGKEYALNSALEMVH